MMTTMTTTTTTKASRTLSVEDLRNAALLKQNPAKDKILNKKIEVSKVLKERADKEIEDRVVVAKSPEIEVQQIETKQDAIQAKETKVTNTNINKNEIKTNYKEEFVVINPLKDNPWKNINLGNGSILGDSYLGAPFRAFMANSDDFTKLWVKTTASWFEYMAANSSIYTGWFNFFSQGQDAVQENIKEFCRFRH